MREDDFQSEEQARRARERRAQSLRELAQPRQAGDGPVSPFVATSHDSPDTPLDSTLATPLRRRRRTIWLALSCVALVVIVIAGVGAYYLHAQGPSGRTTTKQTTSVQPSVAFNPTQGGLGCVTNAIWSPDNTRIAVFGFALGAQASCPQNDTNSLAQGAATPTVVGLYDATTGRLLNRLQPDAIIRAALGLPQPSAATRVVASPVAVASGAGKTQLSADTPLSNGPQTGTIDYGQLGWSPDGKQLALLFFATGTINPQVTLYNGVLLVNIASGASANVEHTRVFAQPQVATSDSTSAQLWQVWNTLTGAPVAPLTGGDSTQTSLGFVSPTLGRLASTYSWDASGHLIPGAALTASASASPIGNPVGGASFGVWQAGQITLALPQPDANIQQSAYQNGAAVFSASYATWSPDGQYVALASAQFVLQQPGQPAPTPPTLQALGMPQIPVAPARDPALAGLLRNNLLSTIQSNTAPLAWSPNGRLLIAPGRATSEAAGALDQLIVYDSATGKTLAALGPKVGSEGLGTISSYLRWSPDGSRLLYFDSLSGSLNVWLARQLPQG